jgi:hypothetical protein
MSDLTWWQKAGIGALGGLGLAVLKLIDQKFFLGSITSVEASAAYLTYICYMVLGSLAAVFLTDHDLPPVKVRRGAFVIGLLAPSVLLAIANQNVTQGPSKSDITKPIPKLSSLFLSSAYAEERPKLNENESPKNEPAIAVLPKSTANPGFWDAVKAAVGRKEPDEKFVYVVGATPDKQKALDTAESMNALLFKPAGEEKQVKSRAVKLEGEQGYFVVVGDVGMRDAVLRTKVEATSAAVKSLATDTVSLGGLAQRKELANLLVGAQVVPASALATR